MRIRKDGRVRLHDPESRTFASDNYAGALPEVLAAIADANGGHQIAYGEDVYTARLGEVITAEFGEQAEVFPVFNGTGRERRRASPRCSRAGARSSRRAARTSTPTRPAPPSGSAA